MTDRRQASSFYPHFSQAEKPEVDKFVGFFNRILYQGGSLLTDFLDPGQRDILKIIAGDDMILQEFGGYSGAEKKRVYMAQEWANLRPADYGVSLVGIEYPRKFNRLTHSAILGTLASSGVDTATFGDIITDGRGQWQFFAETDLLPFFCREIKRAGRSSIRLVPLKLTQALTPADDSREETVVASSLRLDAVLSKASRLSRREVKQACTSGLIKLNWHEVKESNIIVKRADVISLRHFGRVKLVAISATRKGRYKVVLKIWQSKRRG